MMEHFKRVQARVAQVMRIAKVLITADDADVQKMQVHLDGEVHDNLASLAHFGFTSVPPLGSDVVVLFANGERSNGVAVASNHKASRVRGLAPGDVAVFDVRGICIRLSSAGITIDGKGLPITINNAPTVTVNGGDVVADGISLKNHVHGGVSRGSAKTNPPS